MVTGKRAQLFLLAAVIISVVVLSLGVTTNRAIINREPEGFYEFSYEVQRESSAALDYEIYTDIEGTENDLYLFINSLVKNVKDKEPDANFVVIYGNNITGITIISKWGDSDSASQICYSTTCIDIVSEDNIKIEDIAAIDLEGLNEFVVKIEDQDFTFPITEYYQIIFIIQKEVEDESYVAIE